MSFTYRPAVRSNVGLFVGVAGGTGAGKTMSALRLATGIVGRENKFAVVDAENGRARHYAPRPGEEPDFKITFRFDVLDLAAPFSSERYEGAVKTAVDAGYKCVVVDSATHEHDSVGGYLDMQAHDLEQRVERYMKKYPNAKELEVIEKLTPSSWILPKRARNRMMETLLACSTSIPIVFCFRAEEKVFSTKDGKLVANNPPIWTPICGKTMPFEMTAFLMLYRERPGYPSPIKVQEQHKHLFPPDKPLDEEAGRLIAQWAAGGAASGSAGRPASGSSGPVTTSTTVEPPETYLTRIAATADRAALDALIPGMAAASTRWAADKAEAVRAAFAARRKAFRDGTATVVSYAVAREALESAAGQNDEKVRETARGLIGSVQDEGQRAELTELAKLLFDEEPA